MRAKEYLEIKKEMILCYDIVKIALDDLSLLRNNLEETEKYFNKYLYSDIRYLLNPDEFVLNEGELNPVSAMQTRSDIMDAIREDKSFIHAYNIIIYKKKDYSKENELKIWTDAEIENYCRQYRDDYPKYNVDDYLCDKARLLLTTYKNDDKVFENTVVDLVRYLVSAYDFDLCEKQKESIEFLSDRIESYFTRRERKSPEEIIKELENALKAKDDKIKLLEQEVKAKDQAKGFTIAQQNIFFYYIFDRLGINFESHTKTQWAKLICWVIGKNEENIRKALSIKFDNPATQKDMKRVAEVTRDLLPFISKKIMSDLEG